MALEALILKGSSRPHKSHVPHALFSPNLKNRGIKQKMKYQPGQSGNPKGKPKGALNKKTRWLRLLDRIIKIK